jgi:type IV secretory pathway protease TraF
MEDGHWIAFTPGAGKDRNIPPVRIGAHEYFLVRDNRDNSADSRIWGPLSESQILGKVVYIIRRQ